MKRPSSRLTCSKREVALFLMLGEALKRLPPSERKLYVSDHAVAEMAGGWMQAGYHFGMGWMDEKKFTRIWKVTWKNKPVPDMKYVAPEEKSRVFNL